METGCAVSGGSSRSSAASTASRSSSKKGESFIVGWNPLGQVACHASRFALPLWIERFCAQLAVRLFQKDLDAALGFFELFLAFARKRHAFLEELHGVVQRKLRALQAPQNLL